VSLVLNNTMQEHKGQLYSRLRLMKISLAQLLLFEEFLEHNSYVGGN